MILVLMCVCVCVEESYWKGGKFIFEVKVPEEYNNKVRQWNSQVVWVWFLLFVSVFLHWTLDRDIQSFSVV